MSEPTKSGSLSKSDEALLDRLAESSEFWGSIRAGYAQYDGLTPRQAELFTREKERAAWQADAPRVAGVPVRNHFTVKGTNKPRCANREKPFCQAEAIIVVGSWAYCSDHASEAREALEAWKRDRDAERAAETKAAAEAAASSTDEVPFP